MYLFCRISFRFFKSNLFFFFLYSNTEHRRFFPLVFFVRLCTVIAHSRYFFIHMLCTVPHLFFLSVNILNLLNLCFFSRNNSTGSEETRTYSSNGKKICVNFTPSFFYISPKGNILFLQHRYSFYFTVQQKAFFRYLTT